MVRTKKALETAKDRPVVVTTDSPESRDNIVRFAERSGCSVTTTEREAGVYIVEIHRHGLGHNPKSREDFGYVPRRESGSVLLLSSDELGRGDEKLGRLLMTLFLRTLTETPARPACLLLMNGGVKLALEDSEQLTSLRALESLGVTVRVCGTCLDFFGVKDRVRAGTVSNMYELVELLMAGERLRVI